MFRKLRFPIILIAGFAVLWIWLRKPQREDGAEKDIVEITLSEGDDEAEQKEPEDVQPAEKGKRTSKKKAAQKSTKIQDDFKVIEGIGPKISSYLQSEGIHTYEQLADKTPDELRELLAAGKLQLAQPDTWPEQAEFAAKGDWAGLEKLQSQLKGGRRVE